MFERIFSPKNGAEKWKGRIMVAFILIPAAGFYLSLALELMRYRAGTMLSYEQAAFTCFMFTGILLMLWAGFVLKAKHLSYSPNREAKQVQVQAREVQPKYLSAAKVPFTDFVRQPDGSHARQTRWLDSEVDVIELLEHRDMTPNQIRLKIKEYSQHSEVKAYLEYRLSIEENMQAHKMQQASMKAIEAPRVGDSVDLTYVYN